MFYDFSFTSDKPGAAEPQPITHHEEDFTKVTPIFSLFYRKSKKLRVLLLFVVEKLL